MSLKSYAYGILIIVSQTLVGQANFGANVQKGCGPLNVQFSDSSLGAVSWLWDFGNGNQSTNQNPSAIYNVSGKYNVSLSFKDKAGNSFTVNKKGFITVYEGANAYFTASKRKLCPKDTLTFHNQTTAGDAAIKTWIWSFGDGNTSTLKNPVHSFNTPGYWNISLVVTDNNGCVSTKKFTNFIQTWTPATAAFSQDSNLSCKKKTTITFTSQVTTSGLLHFWDFGNGTISSQINPVCVYNQYGQFNVSLKVIDANGCSNTKKVNNAVVIDSVAVDFSAVSLNVCDTSSIVQFQNLSNVSQGYKWNWDFGDNSTSDEYIPSHQYKNFGSYPITLMLSGPGCVILRKKANFIHILRNPPKAITVNDTGACQVPFNLTFHANTSATAKATWQFGDGTFATNNNPLHTYTKDDTFIVTILVIEKNGCQVFDTIKVQKNSLITYAKGNLNGCVPFSLALNSNIFENTAQLISENWFLGTTKISSGPNLNYQFQDTGKYNILFQAINSKGCIDTPRYTVLVGQKSKPSFTVSRKSLCLHDTIVATNTTPKSKNKILFEWFSSENQHDTTRNFTTKFHHTQGNGSITLIAMQNGCNDTFRIKDSILVLTPKVSLTIPPLGCNLPSQIPLLNATTKYTKFSWSSDPKPLRKNNDTFWVAPDSSVQYQIKLYARNDATGCEDSFLYNLFFRSNAPSTKIKYSLLDTCLPAKVFLKDMGSKGLDIFWKTSFDTIENRNTNYTKILNNYGVYHFYRIAVNRTSIQTCADTTITTVIVPKPDTRFTVSPLKGCTPLTIQLIDTGYYNGRNATWKIGDSIITSKGIINYFTIKTPSPIGGTAIEFTAFDSLNHCKEISQKYIEVSGPVVDIRHDFLYNCKFTRIQLSFDKLSKFPISSCKWIIDDTVRSTAANYLHPVYTMKSVRVSLEVTDSLGCKSTFVKDIFTRVYKPIIKIVTDQKGALCPPAVIKFYDSTYNFNNKSESWEWKFGDGSTSTLRNPTHTFLNSGKYTITLKVKNQIGCIAIDSFPGYIDIKGPKGGIVKPTDSGCSPFNVLFKSTDQKLKEVVWDFGDGNEGRGNQIYHNYANPGKFTPSAILEDSAGCKAGVNAGFSITVLPSSIAHIKQLTYCENQPLAFKDMSQYFGTNSKNLWKINSYNGKGPVFQYTGIKSQKDTIVFIAFGELGCNDTINYIPIKSYIKPSFTLSKDTLCLGDSLHIFNQSKSDTSLVSYSWQWHNQQSILQNPILKATEIGVGDIELTVTNSRGCVDTLFAKKKTITGDSVPPISDGFKHITVTNDHRLEFNLNPNTSNDWRQYLIYEYTDWNKPVISTHKSQDTVLYTNKFDVLHNSYCFGVKNENLCFKQSLSSRLLIHCQINIEATPDTNVIRVKWNPYSGNKPVEYRLYRTENNGPPLLVNTTTGQTYYYIDKDVKCHRTYSYRIEAVFNDATTSSSDTSMAIPIYKNSLPNPHIYTVSVLNSNAIELEIQTSYPTYEITAVHLEKSVNTNLFKPFLSFKTPAPNYIVDSGVNTNEDRSYYRFRIEDICGGLSPYSPVCSPILLQAEPLMNEVKLSWNGYTYWPGGVNTYWVESGNLQGGFETVAKTSDTQLTISNIGNRCGEIPKFRITAISNPNSAFDDSTKVHISLSNEANWKSSFFALTPNAFTPTGNNLNEVFKPEVLWVKTYSLLIYDRWGNKIHETNGCGAFWDGSIDGKLAPDGCYVYRLDVIAVNGQKLHKSGTVLLLK